METIDVPATSATVAAARSDEARGADELAAAELKRKTAKGAMVSAGSQVATLVFRTGGLIILARLLTPADFGLVGMVAAFTGFLGLFRDAGLSMATVQKEAVTNAQTSTLFWINLGIGMGLALFTCLLAPILATFYSEPRLVWITVALGLGFLFNGASAQHRACLLRSLRFTTLAVIEFSALLVSTLLGISMAWGGWGYWALVASALGQPAVSAVGMWLASGWVPGPAQRRTGIRSMLKYGGAVTLNSVIVYLAYNAEKVLLGRFWGADMLGLYGRAYQLINIPTENLNSAVGVVAFPALARVQNDPVRLRSYFLKGYSLFLSLVMPITVACAVFAEDIIRVFLGERWVDAISVFRLLAPTILAFALINPFAWLMLATGMTTRSLKIALMIAPVVILGYVVGLPYGPNGVAIGYSSALIVLIVPMILWAKHGTMISMRDVVKCVGVPLVSVLVGVGAALASRNVFGQWQSAFARLVGENVILFGVYALTLLFGMKQLPVYRSLLQHTGIGLFRKRP